MRSIDAEEELQALLEARPEETTTFAVPPNLAGKIPVDPEIRLREMESEEIDELASYLAVDAAALEGPFRVADINCPNCGRSITFLDFVKTAVDQGIHPKERLIAVLTGTGGQWITIRGNRDTRSIACVSCGFLLRMQNGYSEYSNANYAYA